MSLRALPLIIIAFILYNVLVLLPDGVAMLKKDALPLPLMTTTLWLTWGDILILITMGLLFVELMKSTYTSTASLLDHGLSMLVFVACLVEFLLVQAAGTAVFFFITVATLIDVIAGYTIGIRVARRDLAIGEH
ncbi:MAG: hypothetical protein AB7G35_23420 [Hyphomicrobiaceae bacterium]